MTERFILDKCLPLFISLTDALVPGTKIKVIIDPQMF